MHKERDENLAGDVIWSDLPAEVIVIDEQRHSGSKLRGKRADEEQESDH